MVGAAVRVPSCPFLPRQWDYARIVWLSVCELHLMRTTPHDTALQTHTRTLSTSYWCIISMTLSIGAHFVSLSWFKICSLAIISYRKRYLTNINYLHHTLNIRTGPSECSLVSMYTQWCENVKVGIYLFWPPAGLEGLTFRQLWSLFQQHSLSNH